MKGDLYCHTQRSDGSMPLKEIAHFAKQKGLQCLAYTDHDCFHTWSELEPIQKQFGLRILQGVELSCYDYLRNKKVHILCYQPQYPDYLAEAFHHIALQRKQAGLQMAQTVCMQYNIPLESITRYAIESRCIYKQHIMQALCDYGYSVSVYSDLYRALFEEDGSCYHPVYYLDVWEMVDLIRLAGGIAVMAHPPLYDSWELLQKLLADKLLHGIEVWHPTHSQKDREILSAWARGHSLLATGGSDFHGRYNSVVTSIGEYYTCGESLAAILDRRIV